jgi:polyhydroxybutyrate depolymerase
MNGSAKRLGLAAVLIIACAETRSPAPGSAGAGTELVTARPYQLHVPPTYAAGAPAPLIVLLHGYGSTGAQQSAYFGFAELAAARGVLVAYPDGTVDRAGHRFWAATDACCDLYARDVDDVAYLTAVLDDVEHRYDVNPSRVYFVGHSNGGFMAHRMACDLSQRISAIVGLAGDVWKDPARCDPVAPVAVLQVHGDRDLVIPYAGGAIFATGGQVPSAAESVATWAALNRCSGALAATGERLDLDAAQPGDETRVERWTCTSGAAELWTIEGGGHIPALRKPAWGDALLDWLEAHAR